MHTTASPSPDLTRRDQILGVVSRPDRVAFFRNVALAQMERLIAEARLPLDATFAQYPTPRRVLAFMRRWPCVVAHGYCPPHDAPRAYTAIQELECPLDAVPPVQRGALCRAFADAFRDAAGLSTNGETLIACWV
jgi:hypothetical protein